MTKKEVELFVRIADILPSAWTADTSSDDAWCPTNPARGQCAVTALTVNDLFGGKLIRYETRLPNGMKGPSHYANELSDDEVDLTRVQFAPGTIFTAREVRTRQQMLQEYPRTMLRYGRLLQNVAVRLLAQTP